MDRTAGDAHAAGGEVQRQVSDLDHGMGDAPRPAHDTAHTGGELGCGNSQANDVIRAGVQSLNDRTAGAMIKHHHDWRVEFAAAERSEHLQARRGVGARLDHDQVEAVAGGELKPVLAKVAPVNTCPGRPQALDQGAGVAAFLGQQQHSQDHLPRRRKRPCEANPPRAPMSLTFRRATPATVWRRLAGFVALLVRGQIRILRPPGATMRP